MLVIAMLLLGALLAAAAAEVSAGGGSSEPRRDFGGTAEAPRSPIGRDATRRAGGLRVRGRSLVAGRSGQRITVRIARHALDGRRRIRIALERVERSDPRHPRRSVGGERVAERSVTVRPGVPVRATIRGLAPAPGPHRLTAASPGGEVLASARIDVLPQALEPPPGAGEPDAQPATRAAGGSAQTALALAEGTLVDQDLTFQPGSEASSAVAVDPDDPDRVIAAANDFGSPPQAFASNAGLASGSVRRRLLPTAAEVPGGAVESIPACCDPAVAADDGGSLWMAAGSEGAGRIVVGRMGPGSTSFRGINVGLPVAPAATAAHKPAIAVSSGERIAVAWIETLGGLQNVVYSECDISADVGDCDDPDAWSAPIPITAAGGLYAMPSLAFGPSGEVYAAWWNAGPGNAIEIDRCAAGDDCASAGDWDEDATVADLDSFDDDGVGGDDPLPLFCPIIAAPGGLANPSPSVEVDGAGTVYVAYGDLRDNAEAGAESRCTGSGSDKTFDAFVAAGPAPGTLPAPNTGVRLSDDGALAINDHFLPAISADPSTGELHATFYSTVGDPGGQHVDRFYTVSTDAGLSYAEPERITDQPSRFSGPLSDGIDYGDRQGADSAAGALRTVWTDNRAIQGRDPDLYALTPQVETTIGSGPSGSTPNATSRFTFSSAAVRLRCSRDGGGFTACASPLSVGPLGNGSHSLRVRGSDLAGNPMDLTPAQRSWTIADFDPPETTITRKPRKRTKQKRPEFEFVSDEIGARFECRYDREPWSGCNPPKRKKVKVGRHTFRVRAIDVGGNVDPRPPKERFKRKRACPKKKRKRGKC